MSAEPPLVEEHAHRLLNALTGAVVRALRRQDSIAVAVSGGVDSSVLAALLQKYADVSLQLVTVSVPGALDASRARRLARHLSLPLAEVVATRARVESVLPTLVPLVGTTPVDPGLAQEWGVEPGTQFVNPVRLGPELAIFLAAEEARRFSRVLVLGQGADEYLAGYRRYVDLPPESLAAALDRDRAALEKEVLPIESRIANHHRIRFAYPYLDANVRGVCRTLPPEVLLGSGERKVVLRSVARTLALPDEIASVPKTAAQYGSGLAGVLKGLADASGRTQNEFFTGFLAQRRIGEPHSLRT